MVMQLKAFLTCSIILLCVDRVDADAPITATDRRLNGEWVVTNAERGGRKTSDFAEVVVQIDGNSIKWKIRKRLIERLLIVDRTALPNSFDQRVKMTDARTETLMGIYKFDKADRDKLFVSFIAGGDERPQSFDSINDPRKFDLRLRRKQSMVAPEKPNVRKSNGTGNQTGRGLNRPNSTGAIDVTEAID